MTGREEERLIEAISDEPILGPRQGALVDALVYRIKTGRTLTQADMTAAFWLAKVLRLTGG